MKEAVFLIIMTFVCLGEIAETSIIPSISKEKNRIEEYLTPCREDKACVPSRSNDINKSTKGNGSEISDPDTGENQDNVSGMHSSV